ncbi:Phosphonate metabolism protein/1,5-bisphosphokinase (PRPP-forming) PhnN [Sulfitobacter guttiformis KCTC 32187]|nr:Phosphonate metabolism protein/1,5-bisphosphokinase (PRPP-forming) PhnN [Sulfitobacter guttiformis KCTC 32187]
MIAIVGPSGVGKDSVMAGMTEADPRLLVVRRVITREADAGGEDFESITPDMFRKHEAAGQFALSWGAHGLQYGVPASVHDQIRGGHDVLVNLSRGILEEANRCFPRLQVIALTANPDILAARLAARARESAGQIARRLKRAANPIPEGIAFLELDNSGCLSRTVQAALDHLYPVRA